MYLGSTPANTFCSGETLTQQLIRERLATVGFQDPMFTSKGRIKTSPYESTLRYPMAQQSATVTAQGMMAAPPPWVGGIGMQQADTYSPNQFYDAYRKAMGFK